MPPMPLEADAPLDLVTPLTASAAASASQARRSSSDVEGTVAVEQIEIDELARQQGGSARPTYLSSGATRPSTARSASWQRHRRKYRWSRPPPGAVRPTRAIRHRRLRSARPRPGLHALRRLARRRAPQPRRRRPRPRAWRLPTSPLRQRRQRRLIEQVGSLLRKRRSGGW